MSELMLVNPRKKRRKGRRRKMSALQRQYFGKRRARTNPRRKSRRRGSVKRVARRARRAVRRFAGSRSGALSLKPNTFIKQTLVPSAIGGAGALLVDVAWAAVPGIPENLKTGPLAPFVKAAGAVALGLVASKVAGKQIGGQVVSGYLTVFAYNMLKGVVQKAMPQLPMSEYDLGWVQGGQYVERMPSDQSMGYYLTEPAPAPSSEMGVYLNGYESDIGGYGNDYN